MEFTDTLFHIAEFVGTIAFGASGAMIAIDRGLDLFGIVFLSIITATGGGTIRDILLGYFPPRMFYSYHYVLLAVLAAIIVILAAWLRRDTYARQRRHIDQIINIFDAIGLGAFAVTGVKLVLLAGYGDNPFLCIFLGMTTGVGGGILRDILTREKPFILYKYVYALAVILGSSVYYALERLHARESLAMLAGMGATILLRLLATHYRWNMPKVLDD